jgi:hypothetical protein
VRHSRVSEMPPPNQERRLPLVRNDAWQTFASFPADHLAPRNSRSVAIRVPVRPTRFASDSQLSCSVGLGSLVRLAKKRRSCRLCDPRLGDALRRQGLASDRAMEAEYGPMELCVGYRQPCGYAVAQAYVRRR